MRAWIGNGFADTARITCRVSTSEPTTMIRDSTKGTTTLRV